jgi:phosphohistidine phosphatase SixA
MMAKPLLTQTIKSRLSLLLLPILLMVSANTIASESRKYHTTGQLLNQPWRALDTARTYRDPFKTKADRKTVKFIDLINGYKTPVSGNKTAEHFLIEALKGFRHALESKLTTYTPEIKKEAEKGLAETLNEITVAYQLIGNDKLLKGLRTRFPGSGDPEDPDQLSLLSFAAEDFSKGIRMVQKDVQQYADALRSEGTVNSSFPFYVENLSLTTGTQGEIILNEWYQYTELVNRYSLAMNAKGKRMFYFGNVDDVDNTPQGNFPGSEDLDFNGDRAKNSAGKKEAAEQFQKSALHTYFNSVLIAAVQTTEAFNHNNGYELKRHILDARQGFDDIISGFNPLKLNGDFVPHQPTENFLQLAKSRINDAVRTEQAAKQINRTFDQDETALRNALEAQRNSYIDQLETLTALKIADYNYLIDEENRQAFQKAAQANEKKGLGELGILYLQTQELQLSNQIAHARLTQAYERIAIIQNEQKQSARVTMSNGRQMAALAFASALVGSISISVGGPYVASMSFNPYAPFLANIGSARELLAATQQVRLSGISASAQIKTILSEQAQLVLSILLSQAQVDTNKARSIQLWGKLNRLINNYRQSQDNLTTAYYSNPAYRLERERTQEAAEESFETAMEATYYAAKAVEYRWGERYNNPVLKLDGTLPQALSISFDPYTRAESVFSVHFANNTDNSNNLSNFYSALQAWDVKMRQLRYPQGQSGTLKLSLKNDILNWGGLSAQAANNLFQEFILTRLLSGRNPNNKDLLLHFTTSLVDESLFPNQPNLRIENIAINLISATGQSIRGDYSAAPAWVELIMLDTADVRSFFANYPNNDDIITYQLQEGRTLEKSPFHALIEASIDSYAYPSPTPNIQLAGHSPAISNWALRIRTESNNNQNLQLRHLSDIHLTLKYRYGKPPQIAFPQ